MSIITAVGLSSCKESSTETPVDNSLPKVYMTTDISPEGLVKVYEALGREAKGKVAVKIALANPEDTTSSSLHLSRIWYRKKTAQ